MTNGENQNLIERIIRVEEVEGFLDRNRDAVTVQLLGDVEENGCIRYQFTVTRKGVISAADVLN